MKIGLIGYGKMGKDIFSLLFDKLSLDKLVVICRREYEENTAAVLRNLGKSLKRKKLTDDQYEVKKNSFLFTAEYDVLRDCDIVIEAVSENLSLKKKLFADISGIVSPQCLLLTNTSSLDIATVFEGIPDKERCFGLHFFYPVKLTGFVEINSLPENSGENLSKAVSLIEMLGKKSITFSGSYHMCLNQILAGMISHAIYICDYMSVSVTEVAAALEQTYSLAGPFDVLDSIGLGLMSGNSDTFKTERLQKLLAFGFGKMNKWIEAGCSVETMNFFGFISANETLTGNSCERAELLMVSFVLNEITNAASEYDGDKDVFIESVTDILGMSEEPVNYLAKYGIEELFAVLDELYKETGYSCYKHHEASVWEHIFNYHK